MAGGCAHWHFAFAWLFVANAAVYLAYLFAGGEWRRRFFLPRQVEESERRYRGEPPLAVEKLTGKTKMVGVLASPEGKPVFHRIAEVHLPSLEALQACAASPGGKETLAHAAAISTGGPPVILVAEEEETVTF